jgi:hypothetical protein
MTYCLNSLRFNIAGVKIHLKNKLSFTCLALLLSCFPKVQTNNYTETGVFNFICFIHRPIDMYFVQLTLDMTSLYTTAKY